MENIIYHLTRWLWVGAVDQKPGYIYNSHYGDPPTPVHLQSIDILSRLSPVLVIAHEAREG